jgi:hypothetical protein
MSSEIIQVTCTRCSGSGISEKFKSWADTIDKIYAMPRADGTVPKNPKKYDRSCVRCSGKGVHGEECRECGAPRPSHTYFCPTKAWPSEEDPATDEDRALIDASHEREREAHKRGEKLGYPGGAAEFIMKPGGWLDRQKK